MPLVKTSEVLNGAYAGKYCVAAFNAYNYESIKTVVSVAEESKSPVIVMMYPTLASFIGLSTFAKLTVDLAENSSQPVCLHLDHCDDIEFIRAAVKAGFKSFLIDGSQYGYDKNVQLTSQAVKEMRPLGVDIEAEIGHVGVGGETGDYQDISKYTDPAEAKKFVEDTEVDFLAIAIGNAHGAYVEEPKLDINLLCEINKAAGVPLVLHGGSGIPDGQISASINNGIAKLNIGTSLFKIFAEAQLGYALSDNANKSPFGFSKAAMESGGAFVKNRIMLLNKAGI